MFAPFNRMIWAFAAPIRCRQQGVCQGFTKDRG